MAPPLRKTPVCAWAWSSQENTFSISGTSQQNLKKHIIVNMLAIWNPTTVVNLWFCLQPPSRKFMFITFHKRPQITATYNLIPRWQSQVPLRFGFNSAYRGFLKWKGFCRFCILSHSFWGPNLGNPLFFWELLLREAAKAHERDAHHHDPKVVGARPGVPQPTLDTGISVPLGDKAMLVSEDHWWMTIATGCPN